MEAFDAGALAPEPEQEFAPSDPSQDARDRERELSASIEESLRQLYEELAGFPLAFEQVVALGARLRSGELKLRQVLDVSGDFTASDDGEEGAATEPAVRRTVAAFRRLSRLKSIDGRVEALMALSIHPQQLRAIDEAVAQSAPRKFKKQVRALSAAHRRLEDAKTEMVRGHLHLVSKMARRYAGQGLDLPDLMQEGAVGLMRAVERFDFRRGLRFATYAHWWIRQAFTRSLAEQSRTVRLPVNVNEHLFRLRQVSSELAQKLGREPTVEETAEVVGISIEKATRLLETQRPTLSLDEPLEEDGDATLMDRVADQDAESPTLPTDKAELSALMKSAVSHLQPKEQTVLAYRFGLDGKPLATLEEIGEQLGVSRERVRQIEAKALRRLHDAGEAKSLAAYLG